VIGTGLYTASRLVDDPADCYFYHVMEVPGLGVTTGEWDLRQHVDHYLGRIPYQGKRVLEIGPASGFLTFEMERRGAEVIAVEIPDNVGWEFVPYPREIIAPICPARLELVHRLKNGFWYAHAAHRSQVKVHYGDAYNLPPELGRFDIALMANVLLHTRSPITIIEQCSRLADTLVIVERAFNDLEGRALARLAPTASNHAWDTWWEFSSNFFIQFCEVIGFSRVECFTHEQKYIDVPSGIQAPLEMFTVVASRVGAPSRA
jgi:SAM-dependent methyltransferase